MIDRAFDSLPPSSTAVSLAGIVIRMGLLRQSCPRLFHAAVAVSTFLLLAIVLLWPASYCRAIWGAYRGPHDRNYTLGFVAGRLELSLFTWGADATGLQFRVSALNPDGGFSELTRRMSGRPEQEGVSYRWSYFTWKPPATGWVGPPRWSNVYSDMPSASWPGPLTTTAGLSWSSYDPWNDGRQTTSLHIPCSYLAILFALLPLIGLRRRRKAPRSTAAPHPSLGLFRRVLYLSAILSAFCLLTILIIWPLSYYRRVWADCSITNPTLYEIGSMNGRLKLSYARSIMPCPPPGVRLQAAAPGSDNWSYTAWGTILLGRAFRTSGLGVEWTRFPSASTLHYADLAIPFSYLAVLLAILPAVAVPSYRSYRRLRTAQRLGLCPKCHYDLRAHKPGDRCPECGTIIGPAHAPTVSS